MTSDAADRAAAALIDARLNRRWLSVLPDGSVPRSTEDAFAIQERVAGQFGPIGGFKAGATLPGASPRGAPIFTSLVHTSPARISSKSLRLFAVEAEFGFTFARDLPPRSEAYSETEVLDAVGAVHAAIEIAESRFADWTKTDELSKLADNGSNGGLILGPAYPDWRSVDFATAPVSLRVDGNEVARAVGARKGLHPLLNVAWLANTYAPRFGGIRRGHAVLTGSCTGITIVSPGATVTADFGALGHATVVFEL